MDLKEDEISFMISSPIKTREPGTKITVVRFEDKKLCVVTMMDAYLNRTSELRQDDGLLISFVKPHRAVSGDTIRRWILDIMKGSGVNTNVFKAHSTRGAATSAALRNKVLIATILKAGMWRSENTFVKFYNRPVQVTDNSFAKGVLM
jgi:hypothetical protein